jgi:hypothetical protein
MSSHSFQNNLHVVSVVLPELNISVQEPELVLN